MVGLDNSPRRPRRRQAPGAPQGRLVRATHFVRLHLPLHHLPPSPICLHWLSIQSTSSISLRSRFARKLRSPSAVQLIRRSTRSTLKPRLGALLWPLSTCYSSSSGSTCRYRHLPPSSSVCLHRLNFQSTSRPRLPQPLSIHIIRKSSFPSSAGKLSTVPIPV